ncbi:sulfatase [Lewinella sp. JB7]|uniref:sulfatase n=1 Tax=Lewinella sp. JB7 TaxID=2962887 RepID=UPI0020C972B8|nr:sulfatase [Lewinella sp. JB7]MCP9236541.1 sulfatase [Lewinella sp. JB7]
MPRSVNTPNLFGRLGLVLLTTLLLSSGAGAQKGYNVLFIIADDLTATAVSSYGSEVCRTPNIDRLAAEGIKYTRAYCQYPVCGPSRASLLGGYYPTATETYGYVSGREQIGEARHTWPQAFREAGYRTARVSKIFHMGVPIHIEEGSDGADDPASWDETYNSQAAEWRTPGTAELVQGNPDGTIERKGGNVMTIVRAEGDDLVHADGLTAERASELLRTRRDKPFFLAVGMVRPHVPFVAPSAYFDPYPYAEIDLPEKVPGDWDDIPAPGINYVTSRNGQMSPEQQQKAVAAYYASVTFMDAQVGKVLQTLEEEGLADSTIVIFTSDHGFHLGEHDFWMKVSLHEESVRVPLIIRMPGRDPAVCHSFVELLDLYPTVAELAGVPYSAHLQGKSLVGTLDDPTHAVRDMAFSVSLGGNALLVRTDGWAYIQYGEGEDAEMELYDMERDSRQFTNLAYDPAYADTLANMQRRLRNKLREVRTNDLNIDYH